MYDRAKQEVYQGVICMNKVSMAETEM